MFLYLTTFNFCFNLNLKLCFDSFISFIPWLISFDVCLSTFITTPIADINTRSDVLPALINGSGSPVGGIEPVTTAIFSITCILIIAPIPKQRKAENLLFARIPTLKIVTIKIANNIIRIKQPIKPNSSAMIEKMKSDSQNGKKSSAWRELNNPTPQSPPLPIA